MSYEVKCVECGWEGQWSEVGSRTVYEDWGDVSCAVCPGCNRTEYEGMELLVEMPPASGGGEDE